MSTGVVGRDTELASVRGFVSGIPEGALALALEGEAGIGKTTLWQAGLDEAGDHGFRILVARPAESETALSFSGIGDLLDTVLDEALAALPAGQRRALSLALVLGDDEGPPPDPHAIGLALLNVLRALADERPIVVAIDDVQWLDPASAGGLAFAGRRLRSERVGLLCSRRAGLDSLLVEELRRGAALRPRGDPRGRPTRRRRSASRRAVASGTDPAEAGSRRSEGRVRWQPVLCPGDRSHTAAPRRRRRRRAAVVDSRVVARSRPRTAGGPSTGEPGLPARGGSTCTSHGRGHGSRLGSRS